MGLCKDLKINQAQLVELLKPAFPRLSRAAVSVAEAPKESGVRFTAELKKRACELTGEVQTVPQRTHSERTTIWFSPEQMLFLRKQPGGIGAFIRALLDEAMKKAATGATNTDDRTEK